MNKDRRTVPELVLYFQLPRVVGNSRDNGMDSMGQRLARLHVL